jgi:hypothetical protein
MPLPVVGRGGAKLLREVGGDAKAQNNKQILKSPGIQSYRKTKLLYCTQFPLLLLNGRHRGIQIIYRINSTTHRRLCSYNFLYRQIAQSPSTHQQQFLRFSGLPLPSYNFGLLEPILLPPPFYLSVNPHNIFSADMSQQVRPFGNHYGSPGIHP